MDRNKFEKIESRPEKDMQNVNTFRAVAMHMKGKSTSKKKAYLDELDS